MDKGRFLLCGRQAVQQIPEGHTGIGHMVVSAVVGGLLPPDNDGIVILLGEAEKVEQQKPTCWRNS